MKEIDLTVFPAEREAALKNIYRYNAFDTMLYRSNLWTHTHRMLWMLEEILPIAQTYITIDPEKTRILALVHDDAEIITGDIQAGHKAHMSTEALATVDERELAAIDELAKRYPKTIHGYSYRELLLHAKNKDCPEAILVSYIDKVDAYCETLHELYAGNISMLRSFFFYTKILAQFPKKFSEHAELFLSKKSPFFNIDYKAENGYVSAKDFSDFNKPFTTETIQITSDFVFYDAWKKILLKRSGDEGLKLLIEQKEHLN